MYTPNEHPIFPITGPDAPGYNTQGDIVTKTIDGRPRNAMWDEFGATLDIINNQRTAMTNLLGFRTVASADAVAQTLEDDEFEMATEFGEPTGI